MSYVIDLSQILMILLLIGILLLLVVVVVSRANMRTLLSLLTGRDMFRLLRIRKDIFNDLSLILMISCLGSHVP